MAIVFPIFTIQATREDPSMLTIIED